MQSIISTLRGCLAISLYFVNTIFWTSLLFMTAIIKMALPFKSLRKFFNIVSNEIANRWIGGNNLIMKTLCNIQWHVYGVEDLKPKEWYLVVSNHQTWVDILVLQKIFYRKIPFLKFFLKRELFWFPIMGQAWWALDFPFMKRYSKSYLEKHPENKGKDLEITKKACQKFKTVPVSVMNFVEGTRFSPKKHQKQSSPHDNLLKPKAGGVAYVLSAMGHDLNCLVDVTIAYPEGPKSFWDYLCGRVTDIRVQVRSVPITEDMLGDYFADPAFRSAFQNWLNRLWEQKSQCIKELNAASPANTKTSESDLFPKYKEPIPVFEIFEAPVLSENSPTV